MRDRLEGIDILRGLVMVLMALDHTRHYFSVYHGDAMDASKAGVAIFFTRWITHLCAPVFVFLAGTAICLRHRRPTPEREMSKYLASRGLLLLLIDLGFMQPVFAWPLGHVTDLGVMWAIGCSLILMAGLIWLPPPVIAALGIVTVTGHNLLDSFQLPSGALVAFFLRPQVLSLHGHFLSIGYVILPWFGVMAAGYGFGRVASRPQQQRVRLTFALGLALTLLFVLLRASNLYGDPSRWHGSVFSFLNTQKYPPSLLFVCMTLGPALLALSWFDRAGFKGGPLIVYGRVPLFYYLAHFLCLFTLAVIAAAVKDGDPWPFLWPKLGPPGGVADGWGFSLPVVYAVWLCVVVALYPACRWFAALKSRRKDGLISLL